ncbi:MAG: CYTH domain-containing protein [Ilumatobacteraceae bacterium]
MTTEIERKFLVDVPPPTDEWGVGVHFRQGYLAEDGDVAVRIRITPKSAILTVKAGSGLTRTEVESNLTIEQGEALWAHTAGRQLSKVRHELPVTGGVAELDVYEGRLRGLLTVEVEFRSEAEANAFWPPPWFGPELTGDGRWTNAALARHGRPL